MPRLTIFRKLSLLMIFILPLAISVILALQFRVNTLKSLTDIALLDVNTLLEKQAATRDAEQCRLMGLIVGSFIVLYVFIFVAHKSQQCSSMVWPAHYNHRYLDLSRRPDTGLLRGAFSYK